MCEQQLDRQILFHLSCMRVVNQDAGCFLCCPVIPKTVPATVLGGPGLVKTGVVSMVSMVVITGKVLVRLLVDSPGPPISLGKTTLFVARVASTKWSLMAWTAYIRSLGKALGLQVYKQYLR